MAFHAFRDVFDMVIIAAPAHDRPVLKKRKSRLICQDNVLNLPLNLIRNRVECRRTLGKRNQFSVLCECKSCLDIDPNQLYILSLCLGIHNVNGILISPLYNASVFQNYDRYLISCRDRFYLLTLYLCRNPVQIHTVESPGEQLPLFIHRKDMILSHCDIYHLAHICRDLFQTVCQFSPLIHNAVIVNPYAEGRPYSDYLRIAVKLLGNREERKTRPDILLCRILIIHLLIKPDWENKTHQKYYNKYNCRTHSNLILAEVLDNCPERTLHLFFF